MMVMQTKHNKNRRILLNFRWVWGSKCIENVKMVVIFGSDFSGQSATFLVPAMIASTSQSKFWAYSKNAAAIVCVCARLKTQYWSDTKKQTLPRWIWTVRQNLTVETCCTRRQAVALFLCIVRLSHLAANIPSDVFCRHFLLLGSPICSSFLSLSGKSVCYFTLFSVSQSLTPCKPHILYILTKPVSVKITNRLSWLHINRK